MLYVNYISFLKNYFSVSPPYDYYENLGNHRRGLTFVLYFIVTATKKEEKST